MYDIIYIGEKTSTWLDLKDRFIMAKHASTVEEAQQLSLTQMFWAVWPDLCISSEFNFNYTISEFDEQYKHVFKNGKYYDGVCLFSKTHEFYKREIEYRFFTNKKEVDILASNPLPFDVYEIDSYEEYLEALENSTTEMFWAVPPDVKVVPEFNFNYQIPYYEQHITHVFRNNNTYDGICLFGSKAVSKNEFEYRFFTNKKEVDILASNPLPFDVYEIDSYEEYLEALENSTTEMFWMSSRNLEIKLDIINTFYISHHNTIDRKQNHAFIHRANNEDFYNGVFLCSKHVPLSKKEIEYRFPINRKEHDIVASGPIEYDIFEIDSYEEYLEALDTTKTEMFWMSSANIEATIPDVYFTFDNTYDRTQNHAFIHRVDGEDSYTGVFLCSIHTTLSKKEINFRFPIARKEWDIVASGPVEYNVFNVSTYEDYISALELSKTEMFWIIPDTVIVNDNFKFDTYFTFSNIFDRNINHVYLNGKHHDGIILCSKNSEISRREWDYNFITNKKEHAIVASTPKPYDIVFISYMEPNADDNYANLCTQFPQAKRIHGVKGIHNAHIEAAKLCTTPMFWVVDADAILEETFNFNYQVPKNEYNFVHVWSSRNPINDLEYGYGGVKLLPRQLTIHMDTNKPDMTTSISDKFKLVEEVSNTTAFNTDEFNTWKSAFRECVKLSSETIARQVSEETANRLLKWKTAGRDKKYGEFAIAGAIAGELYGTKNKGNAEALRQINNFDWLKETFRLTYT